MVARPVNQSCATCFVWIEDGSGLGFCCRRAPSDNNQASEGSGARFRLMRPDDWCLEGLDSVTLVPFQQFAIVKSRSAVGSFTCTPGATTVVAEPAITASSIVALAPTNGAAVTLQTNGILTTSLNPGVGFTLHISPALVAANGTETFSYQVYG